MSERPATSKSALNPGSADMEKANTSRTELLTLIRHKLLTDNDVFLWGNIVVHQKKLMALDRYTGAPVFPEVSEIREMSPRSDLGIPNLGLSCTTVNKYIRLSNQRLRELSSPMAILDLEANNNFYAINVSILNYENKNGMLTVYTSGVRDVDHVRLFDKRNEYIVPLSAKQVYLRDAKNQMTSSMKVYQAEFPLDDLRFLGKFIMVGMAGQTGMLFDCFMNKNLEAFDIRGEYEEYVKLLQGVHSLVEGRVRLSKSEKMWRNVYEVVSSPWCLTLASVVLVGGLIFLLVCCKDRIFDWEEKGKGKGD